MIFRVFADNVTPLWGQIEPLLTPALDLSCTHTSEDVRRALLGGQAQLWVQMVGDEVEALVTTEFVVYPVGVFCRVWSAGARKDRKFDTDGFYELLLDWCARHQCVGFEAVGRHGWLRKVPSARVEGLVMRCLLPTANK